MQTSTVYSTYSTSGLVFFLAFLIYANFRVQAADMKVVNQNQKLSSAVRVRTASKTHVCVVLQGTQSRNRGHVGTVCSVSALHAVGTDTTVPYFPLTLPPFANSITTHDSSSYNCGYIIQHVQPSTASQSLCQSSRC